MKRLFCMLLIFGMVFTFSACFKGNGNSTVDTSSSLYFESKDSIPLSPAGSSESNTKNPTIHITIGDKELTTILYDTPTVHALLERLPLTLKMQELNGNEKFYRFSDHLPTDIESVGNIKAGDLMLYQDDYLVLFYESHSTSYSYTRIGYIEETSGLVKAVGSGNITVSFILQH